tara:strand:- start:393 stop:1532 length:1140 start_codon:yes stop_codon:yes gene_type:complete
MLVADKQSDDDYVQKAFVGPMENLAYRFKSWRESRLICNGEINNGAFFSPGRSGWGGLVNNPLVQVADVLLLRWINGGFLRPEDFKEIKKPLIWVLSDVWPFTGGCHYPADCNRFEGECGHCPILRRSSENDWSKRLWQRKQKAWEGLDLTIVGPSRWICDLAGRSSLFNDRRIEHIPTGVNVDVFTPRAKDQARNELGIPLDSKVVAFGAGNIDEQRKGFHLLQESLEIIVSKNISGIHLLMFGQGSEAIEGLPFPSTSVGRIDDDNRLSWIYSAADCFVAPSLEENLANTCLEAMSCGVPLVAFGIGGMPDMIEHKKTGYLSEIADSSSLAEGICWVLHANNKTNQLSLDARSKAERKFSLQDQAFQFLKLFKTTLD